MSAFFEMGGHAAYIWPCYLLAALLIGVLLERSFSAMRKYEKIVQSLEQSRSTKLGNVSDTAPKSPQVSESGVGHA